MTAEATESTPLADRLIEAVLPHVPRLGWDRGAILAGAADAQIAPGDVLDAFPRGVNDALRHFNHWADNAMLRRLEAVDLDSLRIRERVAGGVMARIEALAPHKDAARLAARHQIRAGATPPGLPAAALATWRTSDLIWQMAGDTATDYNHVTKRALLSGVWASTFLFWMQDTSHDLEETRAFLDRRIDNVMQIQRLRPPRLPSLPFGPGAARGSRGGPGP